MAADPLSIIGRWKDFGLKWKYLFVPISSPLPINAGSALILPGQNVEYRFPQGLLLRGKVLFDHPLCGIQFKTEPQLDPGVYLTVQNALLMGENVPKSGIYARAPPDTPPGTFALFIESLFWQDIAKFYVFNNDTVVHNVLYGVIEMSVLTDIPVIEKLDGTFEKLAEGLRCRI